jgi:hypothetical protein
MAKKKPKDDELEPMNPDSEAVYDEQISPLMTQIIAICKRHRIPMLASFQYSGELDPSSPGMCTTRIPFAGESERFRQAVDVIYPAPTVAAFTITTTKPGV